MKILKCTYLGMVLRPWDTEVSVCKWLKEGEAALRREVISRKCGREVVWSQGRVDLVIMGGWCRKMEGSE